MGKGLGPVENARRALIAGFCALHLASVLWWLIPAKGYPHDERSAALPAWFEDAERSLFIWKNDVAQGWLPQLLEAYTFKSATWQSWWLFAPNPLQVDDWITVKAVVGWRDPDPNDPTVASAPMPPWGNRRIPIYDPKPLYTSYEGKLDERIHEPAPWRYSNDPKLVENLASGNWDKPLGFFAEYWGGVYTRAHGKRPLGIHVQLTRGTIHHPYGALSRAPANAKPEERVLWYIHY